MENLLKDKKYIIFDFDNTIVDSEDYWEYVINKSLFKKYGFKIDKRMQREKAQKNGNLGRADFFIELTGIDKTSEEILTEWNDQMAYYYTHKVKLIKGIKDFLYSLKSQGKKLVLASATDEYLLRIALKHFDIDIFDKIYSEPNIGYPKRDPEFFNTCLKKLRTTKEKVFFFEDNFNSLSCASGLGINCCGVIHKYNKQHKSDLKKICKLVIRNYNSKEFKFQ